MKFRNKENGMIVEPIHDEHIRFMKSHDRFEIVKEEKVIEQDIIEEVMKKKPGKKPSKK
jgi:hypothetical protein